MEVTERELENYKRVVKECGRDVEYIAQVIKSAGLAEAERMGDRFCANRLWYAVFKPMVVDLVGLSSRRGKGNPEYDFLRSNEAYDAVYSVWYNQLPDCRPKCVCM